MPTRSRMSPAAAPARPAGPLYTAVSTVLQLKGGPAYLCIGGVELSLPSAGCGGVILPGVDASRLPTAHVYANGTVDTGLLRVIGRWDGHALTPTRPIVRAAFPKVQPYVPLRTACARPGGTTAPDPTGQDRAVAAAQAAPDASYLYVSGDGGRVLNAAFTGHLARHRAALRMLYTGPVCVIRGHGTARSLTALSNRIGRDLPLLARHGIVVWVWGPFLDRMSMTVAVADPAVRRYIHHRYGTFVEVHGTLRAVHGHLNTAAQDPTRPVCCKTSPGTAGRLLPLTRSVA